MIRLSPLAASLLIPGKGGFNHCTFYRLQNSSPYFCVKQYAKLRCERDVLRFAIGQLHDNVILLHSQKPLVCCFLMKIKAIVL